MSTGSEWRNNRLIYQEKVAPKEILMPMAAVVRFDDFLGKALDTTNDWTVAGVNSGTAAINVAIGGHVRITTGAADDDDVDFASDLEWEAQKSCCLEVRIANNDVDKLAFAVGFSDATGEAADKIAMMMSLAALNSVADDFVGFIWDPDCTLDTIRAVAVKNAVDQTVLNTGKVLTDELFVVLRVELDAAGNADFYVDGVHKGKLPKCITTTDDLCIYIGVINHGEDAANTADVDYIKAWQNR